MEPVLFHSNFITESTNQALASEPRALADQLPSKMIRASFPDKKGNVVQIRTIVAEPPSARRKRRFFASYVTVGCLSIAFTQERFLWQDETAY